MGKLNLYLNLSYNNNFNAAVDYYQTSNFLPGLASFFVLTMSELRSNQDLNDQGIANPSRGLRLLSRAGFSLSLAIYKNDDTRKLHFEHCDEIGHSSDTSNQW